MKNLNSVFAAYMAVWAIFFVYQFTIARRLSRVREEVDRIKEHLTR
jgi:CcmD family protein